MDFEKEGAEVVEKNLFSGGGAAPPYQYFGITRGVILSILDSARLRWEAPERHNALCVHCVNELTIGVGCEWWGGNGGARKKHSKDGKQKT